jgi:hypothetical protein
LFESSATLNFKPNFKQKINAKAILNLKLSQKLSPQQIQLMKLIQLPTQALSNVC